MFALAAGELGGRLHVVIPCKGYEKTFDPLALKTYRLLLGKAATVETLPFDEPSEQAFYAAGKAVVDACDWLCAVWDGESAKGLGGAADVVAYARTQGKDVEVIWLEGLSR